MVRSLWLLGLAGCPYVFGPPDLSNVAGSGGTPPPTDTDTDTDLDTVGDTSADTAADTGTPYTPPIDTGPNEEAPIALSITVLPRSDGLEFELQAIDPTGGIIGSSVEVTSDNGLDTWGPFVFLTEEPITTSVARPAGWLFPDLDLDGIADCDGPSDETFTMTVTDFDGNTSAPLDFVMHVEMLGNLPEIGNTWPVDLTEVTVPPPFTACFLTETGDLDPTNDQMELRLELEGLWFEVDTIGRYRVDVTWDQAVDLDAYVYYWPTQDAMPMDGISDTILVLETYGFSRVEAGAWNSQMAEQWAIQVAYYPDPLEEAPPYRSYLLVTPD